ncbi:ATP-binding protein [Sphingopyxis yananensis]|uniref:ATP-binding protein n=1 Tax=Sphingopyxis yananensis TaxID=2886687 RepID=UPI001D11603B|nr:ATP-binding protein [Sphingopyxis yananensis]MCC2603327.1 sensor histidine kinase [Sphingopyxis yananensis]
MTPTLPLTLSLPEAHAGRRNMRLLIQLRWLAVGGQLVTIAVVTGAMGVGLVLMPLFIAIALLITVNLASRVLLRRDRVVTNFELTGALLFDVGALTWQLQYSGGLANPFAMLFLMQVVLGAMLLTPRSAWMIFASTLAALALLTLNPVPLQLPPRYVHDPLSLYLLGSLICFVVIASLLITLVMQISKNLRDRDEALAGERQRASEEDHIVRLGLLASGAAHELGTPLSTLSVLIRDWKDLPIIEGDSELQQDLADMDIAVKRCKTIVSSILMSAGEARGEATQLTTMRAFLAEVVDVSRAGRLTGTLEFDDQFGDDVPIVSDLALRQVIGNVMDNAAEVSPDWIRLTAYREGAIAVIEIADKGPGFSERIMKNFGKPYHSTKGRDGGGLGLFLLVNVLRKLGGEASVSNRPEGGALVRIFLPIKALAQKAQMPSNRGMV